jgi:hypothetical protein
VYVLLAVVAVAVITGVFFLLRRGSAEDRA